jgi:3-hydroxybutyryl-CoA dehydrogenase
MKDLSQVRRVAVLGAGTMGHGIAQVAAEAGFEVALYDVTETLARQGLQKIDAMLAKGVEKGKVTAEKRQATLALVRATGELADAVRGAGVVIEAIPEKLELKQETFRQVAGEVDADCLLASNTSSLSITAIAGAVPGPERCIGLHFFNPPPLMKLLEIVRGARTSEACVELSRALARRLGKEPIVVKDSPGFVSSRLGVALGLEAIRMVEEGVATPADIDKAMELGYRHPMGPLRLTDLVGLDVRLSIARYLSETLDDRRFAPPELLERMVAEGKLGQKSGRGFYDW